MRKINYILCVGDREEKDGGVAVRSREGKVLGAAKIEEFIKKAGLEIAEKK